MTPDSLLSLPPILSAPVFALLFFWVALAAGARAMRWLGVSSAALTRWEHGFFAVTMGTGLLQFVPMSLGLVGMMSPFNVRLACLVVLLALGYDMVRVLRPVLRAASGISNLSVPRAMWPWLGLLVCLLAMLLVRSLVFRSGGDDDGYHLTAPKRWLQAGRLTYLPTYTHTNASCGFEMLYVIALSVADVLSAKILHYVAGLLSLLGMVLCARRLGSTLAGLTAASLLLVPTPFFDIQTLFGVAYADFGATLMTLASLLFWLVWRENKQPALLTCLALCVGATGSYKFTALAVVFAWLPIVLLDARRNGLGWTQCSWLLLRFGLLAALPVLPWFLKNYLATGNPVYPMFAGFLPTRDWSHEHAQVFARYVRLYSWGVAQGAGLSEAKRKSLILFTELGVLVVGGAAIYFVRKHVLRAMLGFAVAYVLISVALTGLIFRYWLPATMFVMLVVAVGAVRGWESKAWRFLPATVLLLVACVLHVRAQGVSLLLSNTKIALGLSTFSREFPSDPMWNLWPRLAQSTTASDKVLAAGFYNSVGASSFGGFWSDRMFYVTDSHLQTAIRLGSWPEFVDSLRDLGVTHMMIYDKENLPRRQGFDFVAGRNEYPFCRRLADSYGTKLYEAGGLQLYRVSVDGARLSSREH